MPPWNCRHSYITRLTRVNLVENRRADYVRTAVAKGLTPSRVTGVHLLRNSMIPVVTWLGLDLGSLMGGAIVTEGIFNIRGIGGLLFGAINRRESGIVVSIVAILVLVYLIVNLLVFFLLFAFIGAFSVMFFVPRGTLVSYGWPAEGKIEKPKFLKKGIDHNQDQNRNKGNDEAKGSERQQR